MLIKAILLGLVGIVGVIDSRLIGRQNIGRPLILSTLAGLVLGDVRQGVILGASLELISMGFVAIGAAGPPNMQFGSIIATAFAILSGASTEAALTIAVPVAVIGEFLSAKCENLWRKRWFPWADRGVRPYERHVRLWEFCGA